MLSNAYFLAKFRFDTAENEPAKNLQNFRKMHFRKMHFRKMQFSKTPVRGRNPSLGGVGHHARSNHGRCAGEEGRGQRGRVTPAALLFLDGVTPKPGKSIDS